MFLSQFCQSTHSSPNDVKSDMNRALIKIGGRSTAMRKAVLVAAKRIGEVNDTTRGLSLLNLRDCPRVS